MNRLRHFFRNMFAKNTVPKLICLILAVLTWFFVMENVNPRKSRTFDDLPVTVFGMEVLQSRGLIEESISGETISVTIDGNWRDVMNFTEQDIFLSANVDATGKGTVTVPINYRLANPTVTVKELSQNYLTVQFDVIETQPKPVEVTLTGTLGEGLEQGSMGVRQNTLNVTGPSNVLKNIAVLSGTLDISEMTLSDVERVNVEAQDSQGGRIDGIELSSPFVEVDIAILGSKEVPVHITLEGSLADNYRVGSTVSIPETLRIEGDTKLLQTVREAASTVSIEGKTASFSTNAAFRFPEGIRKVGSDPVVVNVEVQQLVTRQFPVLMSDIEIRGTSDALQYSLGTQEVTNTLVVTDTRNVVNSIKAENLGFYVDAANTAAGNYLLDIHVEGLPETSSLSLRIPQLDVVIEPASPPAAPVLP